MNDLYYYYKETVILETQNNQEVVVFENHEGSQIIYDAYHLQGLTQHHHWEGELEGCDYTMMFFKFTNKYLIMTNDFFCCNFYHPEYDPERETGLIEA